MIFNKLMAEAEMSMEDIKKLTLPQLMCRLSKTPPSSGKKATSYEAYQAAVRDYEERWSSDPCQ